VFLRVNNASGNAIAIETSIALGGIIKDPLGRNDLDQAGLGFAWNRTNIAVASASARRAEEVCELYYNFTVFKALQVTPDLQVYIKPALAPDTNFAVVVTLRTTLSF
jgi:carbohydrate-selective porin OprB